MRPRFENQIAMDVVGPDDEVMPPAEFGEIREFVGALGAADRIVRMAEQEEARFPGHRRVHACEVPTPRVPGQDERRRRKLASGEAGRGEERQTDGNGRQHVARDACQP